jgi:hypothetical protein
VGFQLPPIEAFRRARYVRVAVATIGGAVIRAGCLGALVLCALAGASSARAAWPLSPIAEQQPVRGGFLDPRWGGPMKGWTFHAAVDVAVREDLPTDAPEGAVRQIYAIAPGFVRRTTVSPTHPCGSVRIGPVQYGHVDLLRVSVGQYLPRGRLIGWSCRGAWHVHIAEFDRRGRKLNPVRPGGVLQPYDDIAPPVIADVRIVEGELRARIEDRQSFMGWFSAIPRLYNDLPPYRIALDGFTVHSFYRMPDAPFTSIYAPETFRNLSAADCLGTEANCGGEHWFRLGMPDYGKHVLEAWDANGNHTGLNIVLAKPPRTVGG